MEYGMGVLLSALLPEENTAAFCDEIRELSAGKVEVRLGEKQYRAAAE